MMIITYICIYRTKESLPGPGSHKYKATKIIDISPNRTKIIYT